MADKLIDKTPGRLRSLYDWVTGAFSAAPSAAPAAAEAGREPLPARIGHYAITHKLGEGGMGVVYAARDERLERTVALKTMASLAPDEDARARFWREARAAASVNHPNICQIYEIGEGTGALFIAMELLEGEVLAERLRRGPMSAADSVSVALQMLGALSALHERGVVHRDLKPSNVFLTPHAVKLLDFGLARPQVPDADARSTELTRTGMVLGTPRYMAPEQVVGGTVDARTDLFAAGAILFEMLSGRPAFDRDNLVDVLHATRYEQPPALSGSPAIAAVDRVIRRALAKRPADRYDSAAAMADDLRSIRQTEGAGPPALAHALTRLVVLPFRVLRPDPETDFLAFSLPDAITTSLAAFGPLVLRSSAVAGRFAGDAPDLKALAADADVDSVVMGTLLRVGDRLRATVQLVQAPSGTVLTAHAVHASLGDLFELQDDIARRIVDGLALPLTGGVPQGVPDRPHSARAYELYLRANELARTFEGLARARDTYRECLELDPAFPPAWARIGRCHRVIGKFIEAAPDSEIEAEAAFRRALELSPRLTIAHKFYANLEADLGRAEDALRRLLGEAARHGNDPELFAGLVHACRYCGLFEASMAAHTEARRLDPNVPTSLEQTLLMVGEIDQLSVWRAPLGVGADDGIRVIALGLAGRRDEARRALREARVDTRISLFRAWVGYLDAWLDRRAADMNVSATEFGGLKIQEDPEAIFQQGWLLCDVGDLERGLPYLQRAIAKGYFPVATLERSPCFDALRRDPAYPPLLAAAQAGRARALAAFQGAGGEDLLGL